MSALTKAARGRDCTIRIPAACNGNPETVVACHFRLSGLSGMGIRPADIFIAFGCSGCHCYVDTHKDDETQLAFAHGVMRTQSILLTEGKIKL